jgi:peptidoglycan/LPS O-acetylase OafA/YrhL
MELILAVLGAGPIGYFTSTRRRGLVTYLIAWAVVFPIQTVVVFNAGDGNDTLYWVFNALILCLGIGLNLAGSRIRERRRGGAVEAVSAEAS